AGYAISSIICGTIPGNDFGSVRNGLIQNSAAPEVGHSAGFPSYGGIAGKNRIALNIKGNQCRLIVEVKMNRGRQTHHFYTSLFLLLSSVFSQELRVC